MKNFIKMGVLGLALSFSITACKYEMPEDFLRVNDNQTSVGLVLGDSHISYIYNMKKPQDIFIYAPTGFKIISGNEKLDVYKKHIEPQDMLNLRFKVLKDGENEKEAEIIDKMIVTFKNEIKPSNQQDIIHTGKSTYREGDRNYFIIKPNQKDIVIDLHEYNRNDIHSFYYQGVKNDMRIKLIAPKYHSFIFAGKKVKEYNFAMKKDIQVDYGMTVKADWAPDNDSYSRQYHIKLKN